MTIFDPARGRIIDGGGGSGGGLLRLIGLGIAAFLLICPVNQRMRTLWLEADGLFEQTQSINAPDGHRVPLIVVVR